MRATSKVNLIHPNIYKWTNQIIMIILIPHINPQFHIVVGWTSIPIPIDWFYSLYFTTKIASIVSQLCQWVAPRSAVLRLHQPGAPWEMRSSPNVRTCALYIIIYISLYIYLYIIYIILRIGDCLSDYVLIVNVKVDVPVMTLQGHQLPHCNCFL